jgi:hypothetical protein
MEATFGCQISEAQTYLQRIFADIDFGLLSIVVMDQGGLESNGLTGEYCSEPNPELFVGLYVSDSADYFSVDLSNIEGAEDRLGVAASLLRISRTLGFLGSITPDNLLFQASNTYWGGENDESGRIAEMAEGETYDGPTLQGMLDGVPPMIQGYVKSHGHEGFDAQLSPLWKKRLSLVKRWESKVSALIRSFPRGPESDSESPLEVFGFELVELAGRDDSISRLYDDVMQDHSNNGWSNFCWTTTLSSDHDQCKAQLHRLKRLLLLLSQGFRVLRAWSSNGGNFAADRELLWKSSGYLPPS